jgi:hypothetical protein
MLIRLHPWVLAAIPVMLLVAPTDSRAEVDSLYRAGMMNGHYLYWVPQSGLLLDTLDFGIAAEDIEPGGTPAVKSAGEAALFFKPAGKTLCRIKNPCAMAVLAMLDQGFNLLALTQWRTSPTQPVLVPKHDMIQEPARHTILSDFLWTAIVRGVPEDMTEVSGDFRVQLFFGRSGYSQYDGRQSVINTPQQIRGIEGFSINVKESDYKEDMNVQRTIFGLFVVLPRGVKPAEMTGKIEQAMDRRKLDLSYQIPEIIPIK